MSKYVAGLLLGIMIALPVAAAEPAASEPADQRDAKAVLESFRNDLQSAETDIVSKSISLTTEEATKFWPVFERFQEEQKKIIDGQIAALREYASDYAKLTDEDSASKLTAEDSVAYVKSLLKRDQLIQDLRVKYLAEYSKVLPPAKAARVIHLTRKLGMASQAKLAQAVPLVR